MAGIKGDFTGFYFKGVHSSTLNITRVSGGDRYDLSISPSFQDQMGEVTGANKVYYFGTNEKEREFEIAIAFDGLSETNIRTLANTFAPSEMGALIFDELPYKVYYAKLKDAPKFSIIPFLDGSGARVYKGETTLNFICYDPKAYSRFKFLDEYNMTSIPIWATNAGNKSEWDTSSRLLSTQSTVDKWFYNLNTVTVYNPGDKEAPFKIYVQGVYNGSTTKYDYDFKLAITGTTKQLVIQGASDYPILCIDMAAHLTIGCDISAITYATNADGVYYKDGSNYLLRATGAESAPFYNVVLTSLNPIIAEDLFYAGNYFYLPKNATTANTSALTIAAGVGVTLKGKIIGLEYSYIFY